MRQIAFSNFFRNATNRKTTWVISEDEILARTTANLAQGVTGYREGVLLVQIDPTGFLSPTVELAAGDRFEGVYQARVAGEAPRKQINVVGRKKARAKRVDVVLYHHTVLAEDRDNTWFPCPCPTCFGSGRVGVKQAPCDICKGTGASTELALWEIVAINATVTEEAEPMPVGTLLANHFHEAGSNDGGTKTGLSDADFIAKLRASYVYWKNKAQVS